MVLLPFLFTSKEMFLQIFYINVFSACSPLLCRSHLMPTLVKTARYVSWLGKAMVSGYPSGWTQRSGCSTLTPSSTCRMSTSSPTSARCWVSPRFPQVSILHQTELEHFSGDNRFSFDCVSPTFLSRYGETGLLLCKDHSSYGVM